jgi:hypothetical protein
VEERLAHRNLTGAGLEDYRVPRPRIRHAIGRRDQDVDFAAGTEVELVQVCLGGRSRPTTHCAFSDRRSEGKPDVRGVSSRAGQAVGLRVVERAERVTNIRVVNEKLAIFALRLEQLRMKRVRLLDEPLLRQRHKTGHPSVTLGEVGVGARDTVCGADRIDRRLLRIDPRLPRRVEALQGFFIAHGLAP